MIRYRYKVADRKCDIAWIRFHFRWPSGGAS